MLCCQPSIDWHPWLPDMQPYMDEVINCWCHDNFQEVILGSSEFDEYNFIYDRSTSKNQA